MNKILITVKVPMIEKNFDIRIPISKNIGITTNLLVNTINELSEGHYPKKQDAVIMLSDGTVLDKSIVVKDCGLKNGDTIVMI